MGRWWPGHHHIGKLPFAAIILEPKAGGRWAERDAQGAECDWGKVLVWEPPYRLVLAWQLNAKFTYDPNFVTEVELSFMPAGSGTLVTLEHRNLERFGPGIDILAEGLGKGWHGILDAFAENADANPA